MVDAFNQGRNRRNATQQAKDAANNSAASVNEQIVQANAQRDALEANRRDAKERVLLPDLSAEQKLEQENAKAKSQRKYADYLGVKVAHDAALNADLTNIYVSKQTVDFGPVFCMCHLQRLLSPDDIAGLPMGGTTEENVKDTNARFDKFNYTWFDPVDQQKRNKASSVYRELVEQTDAGATWVKRSLDLRRGKAKQASAPDEFKGKSPAWYEQELNICSDALSNMTKWMRQGAGLAKQLEAVKASKTCVATLRKDHNGNYSMAKKPVTLRTIEPSDETWTTLSIPSFLSIDIAKAIADGDTWETFTKAMERGAEEGEEGEEGEQEGMVKSIVDFEQGCARLASFIAAQERGGSNTILHNQLLSALGKKGSDDFALSLFDLWSVLDGVVPHIQKRVKLLKEADSARAEDNADNTKPDHQMTAAEQATASAALVHNK